MVKELRQNQVAAVDAIYRYFTGTRAMANPPPPQRVVIGFGGTGCGKTCIARAVAERLRPKFVLIIAPPCGGVVLTQWMEELIDSGHCAHTLLYRGPLRLAAAQEWRQRVEAEEGACFLVTSIATLLADATNLIKTFADPETKLAKPAKPSEETLRSAMRAAAAKLGHFDLMILDEFQEFRNGSPPHDEKKAIDSSKSQYLMLDTITANSRPRILGLSATPIVNSSGELFSFLRLSNAGSATHDAEAKRRLLERTRKHADAKVKQTWRDESARIRVNQIVKIEAPTVPPTTYRSLVHPYTEQEREILKNSYARLRDTAFNFLKALLSFMEAPEAGNRRFFKDLWKRRFLAELTKNKRITIAPIPFSKERKRADPAVDPELDAKGNVVFVKDEDGSKRPLGRLLPFDVAEAHAQTRVSAISKFARLISTLATIRDRRVMVVSEFSDVIDLLAKYLRDALPERSVFRFHGGVSSRDKQLANFKEGPDDGILLATRGACGMAVNVESTTLVNGRRHAVVQYQLDLPMAQSLQDQTEGRIKRPIAQGYPDDADRVQEWVVVKVMAESTAPTLESWLSEVMQIKNARCGDFLTDREEEAKEGRQVACEDEEGVEGPLKRLVELLTPYAETKKREREAAALGKAKGKAKRSSY